MSAHRPSDVTERSLFFYEHAGFSYQPKTETAEQGKLRNSLALARAEMWAEEQGARYAWCADWEVGSHAEEYGEAYADGEPDTCEYVLMWLTQPCGHEDLVGSLGCIDDASDDYRRVIQAELALEAMPSTPINDTLAASADAIARVERAVEAAQRFNAI